MCNGVQSDISGSIKHPILKWDGAGVVVQHSIFRSPDCCVVGKYLLKFECFNRCFSSQNVLGKKFHEAGICQACCVFAESSPDSLEVDDFECSAQVLVVYLDQLY